MAAYHKKGPAVKAHITVRNEAVEQVELRLNPDEQLSWSVDGASPLIEKSICNWMEMYAERKTPAIKFPISFGEMTPFTYRVLEQVKQVPFGESITYKELAERISKPNAARPVGSACGRNPLPLLVPCHRIVASNGGLGGFLIDVEIKRRLLVFEDIW